MRQTLRRSCAACFKSKISCDLRTPRCSRCNKRQIQCVYANEPWAAPAAPGREESALTKPLDVSISLTDCTFGSLDPFDSYPQTRFPREQVQRLIYGFLHKIAFQYYPLDMSTTSNPFLISWWPLALGDPALFHVSLQTACLDEELLAQKGFQSSELLMADSVALLRRKVENMSLAVQDGTMNSVITLAAIEFGKGNVDVSQMHVDGVKKLVNMRGGINSVRQTSPLTARMVSWVSMLIMGHPQFDTQDDVGLGDGIPCIPEWQLDPTALNDLSGFNNIDVDFDVWNVFIRLRSVLERSQRMPFSPTQLHDLTCFVIHRLLLSTPNTESSQPSPITQSLRYAIIIYMLIIQGPTYYSHAVIMNTMVTRFVECFKQIESTPRVYDSLDVWFISIGLLTSTGTTNYEWFVEKAQIVSEALQLHDFDDTLVQIKSVLWLETPQADENFRSHWDKIFHVEYTPESLQSMQLTFSVSPSSNIAEIL
ncbi:uncharacterized protein N7484_002264 [Penicillium longicatenatum]|uniref:uncharacterized protein n=1 Tax=Penicillium longicatenatum TaxID=1561947 RepID=UPI0025490EC1|nr:uncharacterized protein N7484_002264 [Penicillium longicatenatum]KAJ5658615.1 hypothetical protein N7484_002264 [Penicillium longicatenatum]